MLTLAVGYEAPDDRGKEIGASEKKTIDGYVEASLVSEVNVGNRDLTQRLDGCAEESLQDLIRDPLAICRRVWCPDLNSKSRENGDEVDGPFAILESEWLPEKAAPAEEQEHLASSQHSWNVTKDKCWTARHPVRASSMIRGLT